MSAAARTLDATFQALGHPARRAVVARLARGPASVGELAAPFDMALPSFLEHVRALERAGLVTSRKRGRVRTLRLVPKRLELARDWLDEQRDLWTRRLDQLDSFLESMDDQR